MPGIIQEFDLKINSGPFAQLVKTLERGADKIDRVSGATQDLVNRLNPMQDAVAQAFTGNQTDRAIDNLISQMNRMGLVFTDSAGEIESRALLARVPLQELAEAGAVAANSLAQMRFNDKIAAEAQRTAAEEERLANAAQKAADAELNQWMAANKAQYAAEQQEKLARATSKTENAAVRAAKAMLGIGNASNPVEKLTGRLTRTVVTLFSVRRVLRYITDAMERAPASIASSFTALGNNIKNGFTRVVVSAMGGMQKGIDKLNKAMNSAAGQRLFRGLERAAAAAGQVVGMLFETLSGIVEFLGNNFAQVLAVAAIAMAVYAAGTLAAAIASNALLLPMLLIVGLIAAVIAGMTAAGATASDIFGGIGAVFGWLYAFIYNIVADLYNVFASFAEFFANFMNDPVAAIERLFWDLFDVVLGIVQAIAGAIDKIFGSNLADGLSAFRANIQRTLDDKYGEKAVTIERMARMEYGDSVAKWSEKGASFGTSLSGFSLDSMVAQPIKSISSDTSAIRKAVSMSEEDLRSLVDVAERKYVNKINMTQLTPSIVINGANTGKTADDRRALADAIKEVLIEQTASGASVATAYV